MDELKQRRMWTRGATNALGILQGLITADCSIQHRLRMIDLMCAIDAVIWI